MKLHSLHYALGAKKKSNRVGRGIGSGRGGTSKKGSNGDKSRSGYKHKFGFEGGQTPLYKKIPIVGFKNVNKKIYRIISFEIINSLFTEGCSCINSEILVDKGYIASRNTKYKILNNCELSDEVKNLKIFAHGFSKKSLEILKSHDCLCFSSKGESL